MNLIDNFLNSITMYRLVLYYLIGLLLAAVILSSVHLISYDPISIICSSLFLAFFCGFVNDGFSKLCKAPTNVESAYITALILALIVNPVTGVADFLFLAGIAVLAMASKYILAINKKHIFNPAAIAMVLIVLVVSHGASWWVGNLYLTPFVIIGGLLTVRKIRREDMIFWFIATVIAVMSVLTLIKGGSIATLLNHLILHSSLLFFGFVMLTEPLTTPPTYWLQILYAVVVGVLFIPDVHILGVYSTPELALVIGNVLSYIISPKQKLIVFLKEKLAIAHDTYDYVFTLDKKISFTPGQYMEWTLDHPYPDSRGNRRYFTIASSPTEQELRIGVKFYKPSSSYKKTLASLTSSTPAVASQLAGDFTLPLDKTQKLVFIAGGIGITPFRSMLKYLIDMKEQREIIVLYSNKNKDEIAYESILNQATRELGIKIVYTLTNPEVIPSGWVGERGRIDGAMIKKMIPDYMERMFYLSGPHAMVTAFEETLKTLHIKDGHIKKDFFPGFV